ncbi:MAG: di-trans,poly-cis-decaprenylcistransferase [Candidatus Aenigmarchaeota archaeon ex4484_56]|nr:MAG: di-trans,poly-cis-decaprenylcistransferase [Candidatus Aenigmarchaeota archaeon ex4484_56]
MLKHVAIIPDGNRRFCKKNKISFEKGYEKAINKIFNIVKWCKEYEIKILSLWGFSTENWKRSETEKKILFKLFENKIKEILLDERINKESIKIKVIGDVGKFPMRILFKEVERKTEKNNKLLLNILLNYGGRKEIISAVNRILSENRKKITEKAFQKYLWIKDEPDLIIRTGGEMRLSGFMPYQSVYAELFFIKKYFPEITKKDFKKIIKDFNNRERRFGK